MEGATASGKSVHLNALMNGRHEGFVLKAAIWRSNLTRAMRCSDMSMVHVCPGA